MKPKASYTVVIPKKRDLDDTDEARAFLDAAPDEARALLARRFLWELMEAARKRADPISWVTSGGLEAEDFLAAVEEGRPHPLLRRWEDRKGTVAANRPAPSSLNRAARRHVVLLCIALERAGLGKQKARERAARVLAKGPFPTAPSSYAIERWQRDLAPPLTPADEKVITNAINRCGKNHDGLAAYFIGFVHFALNPLARIRETAR